MSSFGPGEQKPKEPWKSERAEKALEWALVFAVLGVTTIGLIWLGQRVLL